MVEPLLLLAHSDVCHFKLCVLVLQEIRCNCRQLHVLQLRRKSENQLFHSDFQSLIRATSGCCFTGRLSAQSENVPAAKWIIPEKHAAELTATVQKQQKPSMSGKVRTRLWVNFSSIFIHFYESCLRSNSSNNTVLSVLSHSVKLVNLI